MTTSPQLARLHQPLQNETLEINILYVVGYNCVLCVFGSHSDVIILLKQLLGSLFSQVQPGYGFSEG